MQRKIVMTDNTNNKLSGITFDEKLTKALVEQKLGKSFSFGPVRENVAYDIGNEQLLLLSFTDESEPKLTRAIISQMSVGPNPAPKALFNGLPNTLQRNCKDIQKTGMTPEQLYAVWGPVDGQFGSGIEFWQYWLANGKFAHVTINNGHANINCD